MPVHLKGPFIFPCVYCPSCVWPRISLLRFVSPLQRSQCIFPTLRRGRVWHFDVVPRKGRREINDYTHTRGRGFARLQCIYQRRDTIPSLLHLEPCNIAYTVMARETRIEKSRRKKERSALGEEIREGRATKEDRVFLDFSLASRERSRQERECLSMLMGSMDYGILGRAFLNRLRKRMACFNPSAAQAGHGEIGIPETDQLVAMKF